MIFVCVNTYVAVSARCSLCCIWGRMQNTVLAATSKLKSSYVDVVFTSVCITTS